jgi:peptide/nickel transport system substrate-binding protein
MRLALLAALAVLLAAGPGVAAAETLRLGIKLLPIALDPHYRNSGENDTNLTQVFGKMIEFGPEQQLRPGIAESWRPVAPDLWEFRLRADARFSDGAAVTAEDVAFSIRRVPRIESAGSYAPFVRGVVAAEVVDPRTLRIRTHGPYPLLPVDMARIFVAPAALGDAVRTEDFNQRRPGTVGSGPWRVVEWRFGERMVLEPNPHWYGPRSAWTRVETRQVNNDSARVAALLAGDVQAIDEVPVPDLPRLSRDPRVAITRAAGARVMYVAMDGARDASPHIRDAEGRPLAQNPFKDRRVRLALSHAINRQAIVERVMEGAATVAANLLPDGFPGTSPNFRPRAFDPDLARRLLAEAGWPRGFQVTIHATSDRYPNDDKVAQAIAQMWTRAGVRTEVALMPNAAYFPAAARQEFSVMAAQFGGSEVSQSYRALVHTYDRERGLGSANRTRHSSPRADALIEQALGEMDDARRNALLVQAMDVAFGEEETLMLVYHPAYVYAAQRGLTVDPYADGRFLAHAVRRQ